MRIKISIGALSMQAKLNDNRTAREIYESLPIEVPYHHWGDEIYFHTPVEIPLEEGQEIVAAGDLAYWPPGKAFCIFYGPTPASCDERPRAASPVTVFGHLEGDASRFKNAKGFNVRVETVGDTLGKIL
ncbi:MAG: hypothetical protein GC154_13050 [bacterium]|nr:hypothetical protein [bacterium]